MPLLGWLCLRTAACEALTTWYEWIQGFKWRTWGVFKGRRICLHALHTTDGRIYWMAAPMCQKQGNPVASSDVTNAWDDLSPVYSDNRMNQVKNWAVTFLITCEWLSSASNISEQGYSQISRTLLHGLVMSFRLLIYISIINALQPLYKARPMFDSYFITFHLAFHSAVDNQQTEGRGRG